jgi:thiol-disulfide isomerase/thioredoxin
MVMADWCGHCKQTEPKYKQVADELKDDLSVQVCIADTTGDRDSEKAMAVKVKKFFPKSYTFFDYIQLYYTPYNSFYICSTFYYHLYYVNINIISIR